MEQDHKALALGTKSCLEGEPRNLWLHVRAAQNHRKTQSDVLAATEILFVGLCQQSRSRKLKFGTGSLNALGLKSIHFQKN
jgi:hypothetical protein